MAIMGRHGVNTAMEHQNFRWWVHLPAHDCYVCVPPKTGSTSFANALGARFYPKLESPMVQLRLIYPSEVPPNKKAYLVVRDPVKRFSSLWRHLVLGSGKHPAFKLAEGLSPDGLLDLIQHDPLRDIHFGKQRDYWIPTARLVSIRDLFKLLNFELRHSNQSKNVSINIPEKRVLNHYSEDQQLWMEYLEK